MVDVSSIGILAVIFVSAVVILCVGSLVNALSPVLSIGALAIIAIVAVFAIFGIALLAFSLRNKG